MTFVATSLNGKFMTGVGQKMQPYISIRLILNPRILSKLRKILRLMSGSQELMSLGYGKVLRTIYLIISTPIFSIISDGLVGS